MGTNGYMEEIGKRNLEKSFVGGGKQSVDIHIHREGRWRKVQ